MGLPRELCTHHNMAHIGVNDLRGQVECPAKLFCFSHCEKLQCYTRAVTQHSHTMAT
jgi:hypothetical protein